MRLTVPLIIGTSILSLACVTYADQPHMQSALQSLQSAKAQLEKADRDKGGHRARAEQLVSQALAEVRAGIEFDRTH
jgi:F0F1-type ATP synthase epsilon subunit